MSVQLLVNGAWQLYSKAKLQKMQFSLISTAFAFSHLTICNAVVLNAHKGMSKMHLCSQACLLLTAISVVRISVVKTVTINVKLCMVCHWKLQMYKSIKSEREKQIRNTRKEIQIVKSYKIIKSELSDFLRRINVVGLKGNEVILLKNKYVVWNSLYFYSFSPSLCPLYSFYITFALFSFFFILQSILLLHFPPC